MKSLRKISLIQVSERKTMKTIGKTINDLPYCNRDAYSWFVFVETDKIIKLRTQAELSVLQAAPNLCEKDRKALMKQFKRTDMFSSVAS